MSKIVAQVLGRKTASPKAKATPHNSIPRAKHCIHRAGMERSQP